MANHWDWTLNFQTQKELELLPSSVSANSGGKVQPFRGIIWGTQNLFYVAFYLKQLAGIWYEIIFENFKSYHFAPELSNGPLFSTDYSHIEGIKHMKPWGPVSRLIEKLGKKCINWSKKEEEEST